MAGNLQYCISLLQENEESVRRDAEKILLKLCNNIIKYPKEPRYRKVQLDNAIVSTKLLPAAGAIECLFEIGFVERDDGFLLPTNALLTGVEKLRSILSDLSQPACTQSVLQTHLNSQPSTSYEKLDEKEYKKRSFFEQLINMHKGVLRYEDQNLQSKVKSILPLEKLQIAAMEKLRNIQREMKINNIQDNAVFEDMLLAELLSWFKFKFFKWVNSPACQNCMGECYLDRSVVSSSNKISRIEIHICKSCGHENKFPRYTDAEDLLHTRQGRCGEWANCFTLICRTIGFDARLVYDETDHLWTEVWSPAHNRWIHADACENAMDRPLVYEKGWGKKLTYIIAFSRDEVQDVTWRYTQNYHDVMKRRRLCGEEALALLINRLNLSRHNADGYSSARRKFVAKRRALELAEMLTAPPGHKKPDELSENDTEYGGRTSGSLAWRLARGETSTTNFKATQWTIPEGVKTYEFSYSIIPDTYTTKDVGSNTILEGKKKWQNGVEIIEGGVFRKEEEDWKTVYLARSPESAAGKITWTFVVENPANVCVDSVKLQATTATFNGASVNWEITGIISSNDETKEKDSKVITVVNGESFETKDLKGAIKISVSVKLSGGEGDVAWQHAQLFRQSLNAISEEPSMVLRIDLSTV